MATAASSRFPLPRRSGSAIASSASQEFPDLPISRLAERNGAAGPWPAFAAGRLHHRVRLEHKPQFKSVDLTLQDYTYQQALERLSGRLPEGFAVKSTPPSSAIRIEAPRRRYRSIRRSDRRRQRRLQGGQAPARSWPKVRPLLDFPEPIKKTKNSWLPQSRRRSPACPFLHSTRRTFAPPRMTAER